MRAIKPFLKWAGGKRQLLPEIRRFYPRQLERYWEPFAGSGAVFFDLKAAGLLERKPAFLIDNNADLVGCYQTLRDQVEDVIQTLETLRRRHDRDARQTYYDVRRRFNAERMRRLQDGDTAANRVELAAMLIYLNRTGFNGLFRLNARGSFNVPIGRYTNPRVCDADNLRNVSAVLRDRTVSIQCGSYELVADQACAGDFVYFDPPYAPTSATANFRAYTAEGFSTRDQKRLQRVVIGLARKGCAVLLSNSSAAEIEQLYEHNTEASRAGLKVFRVKARRAINSKAKSRGPVDELLVSNLERRAGWSKTSAGGRGSRTTIV